MTDAVSTVRHQYEILPYPPRDPERELETLHKIWLEDLPKINHYCFAGKKNFAKDFRALVAGGGTGDATDLTGFLGPIQFGVAPVNKRFDSFLLNASGVSYRKLECGRTVL